MKGFRTAADNSRVIGYAGPPSAKATEVYSKYVIVDMFAKGVQGTKAGGRRQVGGGRAQEDLRMRIA